MTNHTVSQSVPIVGKTNELTVTLATNWQLEAHDTLAISITGLNCTAQPAGALQLGTPVDSFVRGVFCYQGEPDVVEFQVAGSGEGVVRLGFCPNKVLPAEHPHLFSIQVLNGLAPQAAPSVAIVHVAATGGVALAPVSAVSVDVTGGADWRRGADPRSAWGECAALADRAAVQGARNVTEQPCGFRHKCVDRVAAVQRGCAVQRRRHHQYYASCGRVGGIAN